MEGGWSDGKLYSLGMSFTVGMAIWINMELAEETGIQPPIWGSEEFDTWDFDRWVEFWQAGTKRSADGTIEQIGFSTNPITWGAYGGVLQWLLQWQGADWMNDYFFDDTEFIANSPDSVAAMERTWELTTLHQVCPTAAEGQLVQGGYWRAGKALCEWYFTVVHAFTEMGDVVEMAPMPRTTCASKQIGPNAWCVPISAQNPETGQMVGLALSGHDLEIGRVAAQVNELPAANALTYRDEATGFANNVFNIQTCRFEEISNHPASAENTCIAPYQFGSKAPAEIQRIMGAEMDAARLGQKSWQEAMDTAKVQIDPLLQQTG
jgi:ABC-type glycerol-3-phosphate transport system substrate-binding protein